MHHTSAHPGANPCGFELTRNPRGQLELIDADGTLHVGIVPVRAFPIEAPNEGISLVSTDGRELVWIEQLDQWPQQARQLIEDELAVREFMPEIQRLLHVSTFSTPSIWDVQTDRGPTQLVLKGEEDIRILPGQPTDLLINSGHGIVFRLRNVQGLDRHSKKLLERFL